MNPAGTEPLHPIKSAARHAASYAILSAVLGIGMYHLFFQGNMNWITTLSITPAVMAAIGALYGYIKARPKMKSIQDQYNSISENHSPAAPEKNLNEACEGDQAAPQRPPSVEMAEKKGPALKISVIIPVRNRENYLRQCLDSVIHQTMPHSEYEVIVADDCSTDNSYSMALRYATTYPNLVNVMRTQNTDGASGPRDIGLEAATGEYLFFLNMEDFIDEKTLLDGYQAGVENASDLVLIKKAPSAPDAEKSGGSEGNTKANLMQVSFFYKRLRVENLGLQFAPKMIHGEDWLFTNLFLLGIEKNKISVLDNKEDYICRTTIEEQQVSDGPLTEAKENLEEHIIKFRTFSDSIFGCKFQNNNLPVDKTLLFKWLLAIPLAFPKNQPDAADIHTFDEQNESSEVITEYAKLYNRSIPLWVDQLLDPKDAALFKGIRDHDEEVLTQYSLHNEDIDEKLIVSRWKAQHTYPPYRKRALVHDVILFGWYYNGDIGGSLNFYALHELLKSAGYDVVVARTKKEEEILAGARRQYDMVKKFYKLTGYREASKWYEARDFANIFVVGSDQLWNAQCDFSPETMYLGCGDKTVKKIAAATSFGSDAHGYTAGQLPIAKHLLSQFHHISVGEPSGVELLSGIGVEGASCILDPIFLCSKDAYIKLEEKAVYRNESQFVFAYLHEIDQNLIDFALKAKNQGEKEKVFMMTALGGADIQAADWTAHEDIEFCPDATSADFLYNMARADFVVTDSYHGACFAVLFHRPFVCVRSNRRGQSCYTVFNELGLGKYVAEPDQLDKTPISVEMPWQEVDLHLTQMRFASFRWLERAFGKGFPRNDRITRIDQLPKSYCAGCGICRDACPQAAIVWETDPEGFSFPIIPGSGPCVQCKRCVSVCPILRVPRRVKMPQIGYAAMADDEERQLSSSGGVFGAAAKLFLRPEGAVAGVKWSEDFGRAEHALVHQWEGLSGLRQSKYIQSDTNSIYPKVKAELEAGGQTLFTGTPCQVAALRNFLGKEYENLHTIDLLCGGVASPLAWRRYASEITKDRTITDVHMRDKKQGWSAAHLLTIEAGGEIYQETSLDSAWHALYLERRAMNRQSCYTCPYCNLNRPGDLTIGDFWSIDNSPLAERNDGKGVSCVIVNTEKGKALLERMRQDLTLCEKVDLKFIRAKQPMLRWPPLKMTSARKLFFDRLGTMPFSQILKDMQTLEMKR
ncbi:MAG: Coenzyme F420 hydrogenase/dehydrogenase, beta subunit C-terminal domain [Clostridiales bacterium]|jgi:glycosyltransferase involved in cell wall biosynthesis/ferredoxin|nr:Coenzyme F420 hydrogenase/dehydrogenase, beta subunit C-terminal domain [Clostridiales bacterium]